MYAHTTEKFRVNVLLLSSFFPSLLPLSSVVSTGKSFLFLFALLDSLSLVILRHILDSNERGKNHRIHSGASLRLKDIGGKK